MTRGNQRDLAREKAQKKQRQQQKNQAAAEKSGNKGVSMEKRHYHHSSTRNSKSTYDAMRTVHHRQTQETIKLRLRNQLTSTERWDQNSGKILETSNAEELQTVDAKMKF
ncbi:Modifier of protein aggregation [Trichinella pseudospiralis]